MDEDIFAPKIKEECSFYEALELLAFGYYPVDDENLLDETRIRYPNFYYGYNYNDIKEGRGLQGDYIGYSKNTGKYYINYDGGYLRIETENELEYYRKLQKALAKLNFLIKNKRISISGYAIHHNYPWDDKFWEQNRLDSLDAFKSFNYRHYDYDYDSTGKEHTTLTNTITSNIDNTDYDIYFTFKTEEIIHYYEESKSPVNNKKKEDNSCYEAGIRSGNYTTEYITLMNNVIKASCLSNDNVTSKEVIIEYIKEEAEKIGLEIDEKSKQYMATFLRPKSWQTHEGRNKVNKKTKK